jgi:ubiquinol-cytochrome c reductase cytochrome b subunit
MSAGSQPDFYMGALEGALRMMPNWQWAPWGHTFAFNVFVPALLPLGVIFGGAAAWPFLEQWITGDRREHHVNDRPRNAPTRTAIGIAAITFYGVLWAEGANDLLADHLDVSLYAITWASRIGIFVGPAIAYWITKRICIGLQRKDNHLVEHGVETGIIRQLPGGEFIEETRPVSDERLAVLTARVGHPPLPPGETGESDVPPAGMRGGLGRVRERLYKVVTESAEMPSAHNGHGNGHGNGHAIEGNGHDQAAIPSGAGTSEPEDEHS